MSTCVLTLTDRALRYSCSNCCEDAGMYEQEGPGGGYDGIKLLENGC